MEGANVNSIEALRAFRAALIKFAETVNSSLTDADADVRGTLMWLERDQMTYWQNQIRKRHDALERAKEALRHKELYKAPHGGRASVVDEQKMVAKCKAVLAEAEQKLINVKRSIQRLHKQQTEFTGQLQRLAIAVQSDLPTAVADLDRMVRLLDEYVTMRAPAVSISTTDSESSTMTRAAESSSETEIDWKSARKNTLSPAERAAISPGLIFFGPWKSGEVKVAQADAFKTLNLNAQSPSAEQKIILAREANAATAIYIERRAGAFAEDSGLFIGAALATAEPKYESLTVAQVLEMRPDLAPLLAISEGTLTGLDEHGIAAVLDHQDRDLWPSVRPEIQTVESTEQEE